LPEMFQKLVKDPQKLLSIMDQSEVGRQ